MKLFKILSLIGLFLIFSSSFVLVRENPQPSFRITGYIEKIKPDSVLVYVPRMKKSLLLVLEKNVEVTDFTDPENKNQYSVINLKEKQMAVFEGVIDQAGFVCKAISFVRSF